MGSGRFRGIAVPDPRSVVEVRGRSLQRRNGPGTPTRPEAVLQLTNSLTHFTFASSAAVQGVVRDAVAARIAATFDAVIGAPLFPQVLRT